MILNDTQYSKNLRYFTKNEKKKKVTHSNRTTIIQSMDVNKNIKSLKTQIKFHPLCSGGICYCY